jgi:hypothetical protein
MELAPAMDDCRYESSVVIGITRFYELDEVRPKRALICAIVVDRLCSAVSAEV